MKVKMQTDGYFVIGLLPNDERYRCLLCGEVPNVIHVNLFVPEATDIPASVAARVKTKTLTLPYRLCPHCYKAKPKPWKLRMLVLEKLSAISEVL